METNTLLIALEENRVNTNAKFSEILPFLKLQAVVTKIDIRTCKGLNQALRSVNRAINLN